MIGPLTDDLIYSIEKYGLELFYGGHTVVMVTTFFIIIYILDHGMPLCHLH